MYFINQGGIFGIRKYIQLLWFLIGLGKLNLIYNLLKMADSFFVAIKH